MYFNDAAFLRFHGVSINAYTDVSRGGVRDPLDPQIPIVER